MRKTRDGGTAGRKMKMKVAVAIALSINLIFMSTVASAVEKRAPTDSRALGRQAARMALWPGQATKTGPIAGMFLLDPSKPDVAGQLHERNDPVARFAGACLKKGRELTGDDPFPFSNKRASGFVQVFDCGGRQLFVATLRPKKIAERKLHVSRPAIRQLAPAALCSSPNPSDCMAPEGPDAGGEAAKWGSMAVGITLVIVAVGNGIYEASEGGSFWDGFMEVLTLGFWESSDDSNGESDSNEDGETTTEDAEKKSE